ncbi:hypothetical protein JZU46_06365 [bacterium]|nr:hypothetical protein [bacterium]
MQTITREIIEAIGKQIEPRQTSMTGNERDTFESMCNVVTQAEKEVLLAAEKTKTLMELKELYQIAVVNDMTSDAELLMVKILSTT